MADVHCAVPCPKAAFNLQLHSMGLILGWGQRLQWGGKLQPKNGKRGLRTQGAPAPRPPAPLIMIISVFFLPRQRGLLMRGILEPSSCLISVCGLFLRQGPRLALCSLRRKGGKWNKTEKPSWGAGATVFWGLVILWDPSWTLET